MISMLLLAGLTITERLRHKHKPKEHILCSLVAS
jgi:hypothetical protein